MALPPCHVLFQFYVNDGERAVSFIRRSADLFLGGGAFQHCELLVAYNDDCRKCAAFGRGRSQNFGDLHLYQNHLEQAREQLHRECRPLPRMQLKLRQLPDSRTLALKILLSSTTTRTPRSRRRLRSLPPRIFRRSFLSVRTGDLDTAAEQFAIGPRRRWVRDPRQGLDLRRHVAAPRRSRGRPRRRRDRSGPRCPPRA